MGLRDRIKGAGVVLARTAGNMLMDLADEVGDETRFWKARGDRDESTGDEESQDHTPGGSQEDDSRNAPVPTDKAGEDPKSLFFDPFAVLEQLGYREKPTPITYATLKSMTWRMPIVRAVINLRVHQMAAFCRPAHTRYDTGFKLQLRDRDAKPTAADKKWAQQMSALLQRTGITDNPRGRTGFESFTRQFMQDSLMYDQGTFEIVPNRKGEPAEWYAVDGSTIRKADSVSPYIDEDLDKEVRHVQIYDGQVITEYTQEELCFGIRNPTTDIRLQGYGTSELEWLVNTVTSLLWAWEYNQRAFSQGSIHKGVLNFKGAIPDKQLKAFRRHWYSMLSGVSNSWRTPITNADDMQWISMHKSNRDMEYSSWFDFLLKITCAIYLMDPVELNFKYGNVGQKSGLTEQSTEERLTESRVRGLTPLLRFYAGCLNTHIIWPINEAFELVFTGLEELNQSQVADLNMKRVKTIRTIDELRAEEDLSPLPDGMGEIILDPVFMQAKSMAQAQSEGGPEGEGEPGADEGEEGGEDDEFRRLLAQYEESEGGGDEGGEEPGKPAKPAEAEKSLRKSRRPESPLVIDIRL